MYKIDYDPVADTDIPTEIAFHNMKMAEKVFNLKSFIGGQAGYFEANPGKTFQDLEKELRNRNFSTHIIAKTPPNKSTLNYKLGIPGITENNEFKYEAIISCRPSDLALKELLLSWSSYEENFNALLNAGMIYLIDNDSKPQTNKQFEETSNKTGDLINLIGQEDPIHLVSKNKLKLKITYVSAEEVIQNVTDEIIEQFGKEPKLQLFGISPNGGPIMAFTIDNKIVSYTGVCFDHNKNGDKTVTIVNLKNI